MEEVAPNKSEIKRNKKGMIVAGSGPLNPAGRPPGKTLKEFAREYLKSLPDEEKLDYLAKLPPEIVWKMAEGNPHQTQDHTSKGDKLQGVPILVNVTDTSCVPSDNGNAEDIGTEQAN